MTSEPIEEIYFKWLCNKVVTIDELPTPSLTYWKLLAVLHRTEFVWFVPNDDNRVEDGLELRRDFLRETHCDEDPNWVAAGCSVLEMLIAFAYRAEFSTDVTAVHWFWTFIENLNLYQFNDASFDGTDEIVNVLEGLVWRTYSPDGRGGLFPIKYPQKDQRDVEIWYQFCDYLVDQDQ